MQSVDEAKWKVCVCWEWCAETTKQFMLQLNSLVNVIGRMHISLFLCMCICSVALGYAQANICNCTHSCIWMNTSVDAKEDLSTWRSVHEREVYSCNVYIKRNVFIFYFKLVFCNSFFWLIYVRSSMLC